MDALVNKILGNFDFALLVFLRISALLFTSMVFGRNQIPNQVKIGLCLTTSVVMIMSATPVALPPVNGFPGFALLCATELLFGVIMGFATSLFFTATFTAGQIIDTQMGFGMVNVLDPQSNTQIPVTGNLLNLIMLIIFLLLNGHLRLIDILHLSLERIPIGQVALTQHLALAAIEAFCASFVLSIQIAMPFIASGLLTEAALGVIIRTVPQMNMFVVGIPLKVIVGLVILMFVIPVFIEFSDTIFVTMFNHMDNMFTGLMKGL